MDNQPSTGGSIVPVKRDGEDLVDEQIDERILRLLGLEYIFDIDYDTYTSLLKEKMVAARMAKTQIPTEEAELLTNEYKKIRGKKGRFKVKKITADSFKKGSAVGINLGKQNVLIGKSQLALPPADKMTGGSDIKEIIDALAEIIKSLTSQNKLAKDSAEKFRIAGEARQRGAKESGLEKGFKFAIKAAEKVIAPIKSLLDRIIDFFVAIFVGRALIKLLDWFSKEENQGKIKAIGRFLGDQWPKLLALYIMFGTGLGKFVGFLTKIVIGGSIKLAIAAARLLAKAGVGKAAGAAKFLGGRGGKIAGAVLGVAATVGTTMAVSKGIENFGGIGGEEQKTQGYSGGGFVIPKFAGGGLNFGGMMGGAGMGSMFGPLGMLLGAGLGSGKIQESVSGLIGGQKGVDKVPAMLTDGEFVMSRGAVQKYGVDTLESMNAAGGGTNQPKIVSGTTYAAGGGLVGDIPLDSSVGRFGDDNTFRRHARTFSQNGRFGTEEDLFKSFKKLGGIPDFQKMVGGSDNFSKINQGLYGDDALDTIRKSVVEKLKGVNNPQSKPTPQPQSFGGGKVGDIPEGMLDPDQPWYKNPRPKTWEILKAKLTGGTHNGITYQSSLNLSGIDADKLIENLKKDPRGYPQVNLNDKYGGMENLRKYQAWLKETYLSQSKPTPQPQSFTESSRKSAGLDDLGKQYDLDRKTNPMRGYADDLPKLNTPKPIQPSASVKPNIKPIQPSALDDAIKSNKRGLRDTGFKLGFRTAPEHMMLPAAGQSSANMMKAVRAPIPASRAIVPYTGGGALARQGGGALATNPLQRINTNMNVSPGRAAGFIKGAKTLGVELLLQYFLDKGMNYLDAKRISGIVDKASKASSEKRDAYIESVRKDLDKEKRHQKSLGGIFDKIIEMGGETGSERMSRNQESLLAALGSKSYQGGAIKGGFGLKDQSFKDMPKTQIMSDDKGRPFVGYKSMRGGKPVYVRGPQPGEGTSNPLEMMGRMINPGAYKDVDALSEQKKYQQASAGSISSLKARGASQLTLANRQSQLKKSIPAVPSKSKVKVVYAPSPAGGGMGGRRGSGASPSVPSFSAVHPNSENRRRNAAVLGVK